LTLELTLGEADLRAMAKKHMKKDSIAPTISAADAIPLLQRQIDRIEHVTNVPFNDPAVDAWLSTTVNILNAVYGLPEGELHHNTHDLKFADSGEPVFINMSDAGLQRMHVLQQIRRKSLLEAYVEQLRDIAGPNPADSLAEPREVDLVKLILRRFHIVARQLTRRHDNRETIEIRDEYDVQDLLHALLRLYFDDIRPEEWAPSYAGGSSRMDFLLKNERLVIEAKMTRAGLTEKQIGEQLIVDAARYSTHPDCTILVCFIYDPEAHLKNPRGLEADLAKLSRPGLRVLAFVAP
jgi:REase_DpnII-MboI